MSTIWNNRESTFIRLKTGFSVFIIDTVKNRLHWKMYEHAVELLSHTKDKSLRVASQLSMSRAICSSDSLVLDLTLIKYCMRRSTTEIWMSMSCTPYFDTFFNDISARAISVIDSTTRVYCSVRLCFNSDATWI